MNDQPVEVDDITEITSAVIEKTHKHTEWEHYWTEQLTGRMWKSLQSAGVNFQKEALNKNTAEENIPET